VKPLKWKRLKLAVRAWQSILLCLAVGGWRGVKARQLFNASGVKQGALVGCCRSASVCDARGKVRRKVIRPAMVGSYSLCAETCARPRKGKKVHAYMASGFPSWCSLLLLGLQPQKLWLGVRLGASGGGFSYCAPRMLTKWL
jgi:hypothetical protein